MCHIILEKFTYNKPERFSERLVIVIVLELVLVHVHVHFDLIVGTEDYFFAFS